MPVSADQEIHVRQQELIVKMQQGNITDDEGNELIASLGGIVVKMAQKFRPSLPDYDLTELISEGNYALWSALPKFDHTRNTKPSTFAWWVVSTHFAKRWHHQRTRRVKISGNKINSETGKSEKIRVAPRSLESYTEEHGDISELGFVNDRCLDVCCQAEVDDQLTELRKICENDILVHRVVLGIVKLSAAARRQRPREIIGQVARELGIEREQVEDIVSGVREYLSEGDILLSLATLEKQLEEGCARETDVAEMMMKHDDTSDAVELARWMGVL